MPSLTVARSLVYQPSPWFTILDLGLPVSLTVARSLVCRASRHVRNGSPLYQSLEYRFGIRDLKPPPPRTTVLPPSEHCRLHVTSSLQVWHQCLVDPRVHVIVCLNLYIHVYICNTSAKSSFGVQLYEICSLIVVMVLCFDQTRRDKLSRSFFQKMSNPASCLHHLLPPRRNTSVTSRLRSCTPLPRPTSRTKKFQSFINFALSKYQSPV